VSVIKNVGRSVGGSLSHGHQQIALTNVLPRRIAEDRAFRAREGRAFTAFMLEENPAELTVLELETGRLVVPYFMRRPYDMQYLLSDDEVERLSELSTTQLSDLATALARGMELSRSVLERLDVEVAYNVVFHTGTGGGVYLEFLPYTQALGGFEQLGLSACQSTPRTAAAELKALLRAPGT
jgi:galactose-1-phosphate uridylyltransferase